MADAMPPIVIDGDGHLEVFPTVALACQAVEAEDVGLYEVFDSEGRALRLVAHGNRVSIEVLSDSHPETAELERRLRDHINAVGAARVGVASLDDAPLLVMLNALIRFERNWHALRRRRRKSGAIVGALFVVAVAIFGVGIAVGGVFGSLLMAAAGTFFVIWIVVYVRRRAIVRAAVNKPGTLEN